MFKHLVLIGSVLPLVVLFGGASTAWGYQSPEAADPPSDSSKEKSSAKPDASKSSSSKSKSKQRSYADVIKDYEAIDGLIAQRAEARKARDFALSDQIRDDLKTKGVIIEDTRDGASWHYADE